MSELSVEFIEKLKRIASRPLVADNEDFQADDWSGGNFDDAFEMGVTDGRVEIAREVLAKLGVEYEIDND